MTVSARRAAALSDRARDRVPLQPAADGAPAEQERRGGPASPRPGDTRDEWGAASPVQPVVDPERETLPVCGDGHGGCRWPRPCPVVPGYTSPDGVQFAMDTATTALNSTSVAGLSLYHICCLRREGPSVGPIQDQHPAVRPRASVHPIRGDGCVGRRGRVREHLNCPNLQ